MDKRWLMRVAPVLALAFVSLLVAGCAGGAEDTGNENAMEEPAEAADDSMDDDMAMGGLDPAILDDPARPAEEVAQDAERMPMEVYDFLDIDAGMTVADLWPGGGYNTYLLSKVVGDEGEVYSALGFYTQFNDGQFATDLRNRVETDALDNVMVVDTIAEIPAGTLDAAIAVRNYHDVYGFGGDPAQTVADIHSALKPGGIVGIVEVATDREGWDDETHRLNEQTVIADFTGGGFELVESSEMLASADDDHSASGFDTGRHTLDRYLLKFRKVEAAPASSN